MESRAWCSRPSVGGAWSVFLPCATPLSPQCFRLLLRNPGSSHGVHARLLVSSCSTLPPLPALASVILSDFPGPWLGRFGHQPHGIIPRELLNQRGTLAQHPQPLHPVLLSALYSSICGCTLSLLWWMLTATSAFRFEILRRWRMHNLISTDKPITPDMYKQVWPAA